jgi:hypothetical protein
VPPADGKKVWHCHSSNRFNAAPAASFNPERPTKPTNLPK